MKASLTVALAIAGVCLTSRTEAQTVVVGPQSGSMALRAGARVTVPIVADLSGSGGASLGSATARLAWRPGVLAYVGATGGALGQPTVNADSAGGSLRFAVANPAGATGQPILVNATFAVVGAPGADDTLHLTLQELTAAGTFADLLPSGVVTPSHLCVSTGDFGDVNEDGAVNSFDALLMITSAVGLPIAPYTVVNGDVDGDGQVTTRDALVALSYAIALPVDGFRVGALNPGTCSIQTAASVRIAPRNAAVAVGDRFPLTATVRDSAGTVVQGVGLVWSSADTTVVRADAAGRLVGAHAGSALVFAFAAPGLRDSATVTVDSLRHVWWVDPAVAALNGGVELGSSLYPFSSIGQALTRAAAGDSVMIAPAVYGEAVHFARALTLVGDTTAAGVTTIRNPTGPGIAVDSLPGGGLVRIDRLRIVNSQGGVLVHGNGTGTVSLARLGVTQSTGAGVSVRNVARLALDQIVVDGAVQLGIGADSVPEVRVHAVGVDAVSPAVNASARPVALRVGGADSLLADSLQVGSAGVWVDSAHVAAFSHFRAVQTAGAALAARIATSFSLDSADIQGTGSYDYSLGDTIPAVALVLATPATGRITATAVRSSARLPLYVGGGDSVLVSGVSVQNTQGEEDAAVFENNRRVAVEFSSFLDNSDADVYVGAELATIDSTLFRGTHLQAEGIRGLHLRRSAFQGGTQSFLQAHDVDTLTLQRVDMGGLTAQPDNGQYGGPFAVRLVLVDQLSLDSVSIHDNPFGALYGDTTLQVTATRSQFLRNGTYGGILNYGVIGDLVFEVPKQVSLQGVSLSGGGNAGLWLRTGPGGSRTVVDSSSISGSQGFLIQVEQLTSGPAVDTLVMTNSALHGRRGATNTGITAPYALARLALTGSTIDSLGIGTSTAYSSGQVNIQGNTFTGMGTSAFQATLQDSVVFDSNTVAGCWDINNVAVLLYQTNARITRNAISGCWRGIESMTGSNTRRLLVSGNHVARDSSSAWESILVSDSYDSVAVVGNTLVGGRGIGVHLSGAYSGIGAARVDSNTVQGILGNGIVIDGQISGPVQLIYNVVADNDTDGVRAFVPLFASANTVVRNGRYGLYANSTGSTYFRSSNFVGNVQYGVWNDYGEYYVFADSSYWGDAIGPRCTSGCNATSVGDSITTYATFAPYSSTLVAGAPPIPAPLPAPPFRTAARAAVLPAGPVARPRPSASVQPRRVRP